MGKIELQKIVGSLLDKFRRYFTENSRWVPLRKGTCYKNLLIKFLIGKATMSNLLPRISEKHSLAV